MFHFSSVEVSVLQRFPERLLTVVKCLLLLKIKENYKSFTLPLKGCLCYKTITSHNVPSEAQVKNFFIS